MAYRDATYATSEYKRGNFVLVIRLDFDKIDIVEKLLKNYFKKYNKSFNGGTEFFDYKIKNKIITFLHHLNLNFLILSSKEINKKISFEKIY